MHPPRKPSSLSSNSLCSIFRKSNVKRWQLRWQHWFNLPPRLRLHPRTYLHHTTHLLPLLHHLVCIHYHMICRLLLQDCQPVTMPTFHPLTLPHRTCLPCCSYVHSHFSRPIGTGFDHIRHTPICPFYSPPVYSWRSCSRSLSPEVNLPLLCYYWWSLARYIRQFC